MHTPITKTLNLEDLVKKNEFEFGGKKAVYLEHHSEDSSNKSLIISMSTHNFYEKYMLLKNFAENQQTSLLFIKDPKNSYYLEQDQGNSFKRLIQPYIEKYGQNKVTLFGTSMSGYGALYHSLDLGTNAILNNPQICFNESYEKSWADLRNTLDKVRNHWINLDEKLSSLPSLNSCFYFVFGNHRMDIANRDKIMNSSTHNSRMLFQQINDPNHGFYFTDVENIYKAHNLLMEMTNITLP